MLLPVLLLSYTFYPPNSAAWKAPWEHEGRSLTITGLPSSIIGIVSRHVVLQSICPCFLRPLSWASISYKSNTFESRFRCCSFTWSMRLGVALSMGLLGWRSFSCWHYVWLYANFILYSCIQFLLGVWCDWLCSNLPGLLQKLLKRLSINALEFEMLLAGMDGGEADGNSDGIDAKQAVWFYGGPPKVGKFQR